MAGTPIATLQHTNAFYIQSPGSNLPEHPVPDRVSGIPREARSGVSAQAVAV